MAKVYISLGTNLGDKEQNLRTAVQKIEEQVGKVISLSAFYVYSDRLIDIDLLLYDDLILSVTSPSGAALNLPHPLMAERDFVMRPLTEIAPELVHPVLGKTMKALLAQIEK